MVRITLAILAGIVLNFILASAADHILHTTGFYPPYGEPFFETGPLLVAFAYRAVFIILGAYLTASIAREKSSKAILILGIIGSLLWLAGGIAMWNYAPAWYNLIGAVLGVPLSLLGGSLYKKKRSLKAI